MRKKGSHVSGQGLVCQRQGGAEVRQRAASCMWVSCCVGRAGDCGGREARADADGVLRRGHVVAGDHRIRDLHRVSSIFDCVSQNSMREGVPVTAWMTD